MNITNTINQANHFIDKLETSNEFKLFERSEDSCYATCFAIFIKSLLKQFNWLDVRSEKLAKKLNIDLYQMYQDKISDGVDWRYDKSFLQFYCFVLSSLNILNRVFKKLKEKKVIITPLSSDILLR